MNNLDEIVTRIRNASSLVALHDHLIEFEAVYKDEKGDRPDETDLRVRGVDICELPTFGGPMPESTAEVWSWDEDSLLVGTGAFHEWEIIDRKE